MRNKQLECDHYGFSLTAPIHVAGFYEERVYVENLRTAEGKPLQIERLGSNLSAETGHPIDVYKVVTLDLFGKTDTIYIDLYGACDWRAPEGYTLLCGRPEREGDVLERELGDDLQAMIRLIFNRKE